MHPDIAFRNFSKIYGEYIEKLDIFNEADTRAKLIDRILKDCLAWEETSIKREDHVDSGFTDYQLLVGNICRIVIEAKKSGEYFEIPNTMTYRKYKISGSISTVSNLKKALNQVRNYCNDIGCKYAAVFNGHQLVIFSPIMIGKPWTEGQCVVFKSLDDIRDSFNLFWNILSSENVASGSLMNYLEKDKRNLSFNKVLTELHDPDQSWARNRLYTYIQPISDLVFSELLDEKRAEVLKQCYIYDKSNIPVSNEMKNYFVDKMPHFAQNYKIKDIIERELKAGIFQKEYMIKSSDRTKGSLIVLLGGIGCGKSTFLHRFFKIILSDHQNLLWFYIDFRNAPLKEIEIEPFILDNMLDQWKSKYEHDLLPILEKFGFSQETDGRKDFFSKLFNLLFLSKFSITLIIDNVDQHEAEYQEKIFILANHLSDLLKTVTIIALREETFLNSTRIGVFDAYYVPKFHISSPNFLSMILKRIDFTLKLLSHNNVKKYLDAISADVIPDLSKYFSILASSLNRENKQSRKIVRFIDNVSVGNMREALRMFNNFIVSGNTNIKEIFDKHKESGKYQLAYHQFIKSIMLGEHKYYSQERSQIMNIFDFDFSITDSPFNILRILQYLFEKYNKKSPIGRGYVLIDELISKGEEVSIPKEVVIDSLLRLSDFNLVEFDNQSRVNIRDALYVKITYAGKYYLQNLIYDFIYLDTVLVDTPISNNSLVRQIKYLITRKDLKYRLERTKRFITYLSEAEVDEYKDHPEYLHNELTNKYFVRDIAGEFAAVERVIREKGNIPLTL